jgi:SsrA-binding protein
MKKIVNKNAYREYDIQEKLEAGIKLTGAEVKAVRTRGIQLKDAIVRMEEDQAYLINANINPYPFARRDEQEPKRKRKLLLKENQIKTLKDAKKAKLTIVPVACYTKGRWIKVLLGIGKRKTKHQKKKDLIKKEQEKKMRQLENERI